MGVCIHPSAIVDESADLGDGVEIGAYCYVGPRVSIGAGTRLLHRSSIMEQTTLGERNTLYPGCVLGADPQDKKFVGEDTILEIGNGNTFRENVSVNRGTGLGGGKTVVGDDCLIMAGVHIAHDCILGNRVTMANNVLLGGHIVVEDDVGFGGFTAVHHYVSIGRFAFIGGMTRVVADAPPFLITEGHPSRVRAVNRVGLERGGFDQETINWLKEAFRKLYQGEGNGKEDILEQLRGQEPIPEAGRHFIHFMAASLQGKRGRVNQP